MGQNVRIEMHGVTGTKVWIDDVEQRDLVSVQLVHDVGEVPRLSLTRLALNAVACGPAIVDGQVQTVDVSVHGDALARHAIMPVNDPECYRRDS
jgi:hypothetical protein